MSACPSPRGTDETQKSVIPPRVKDPWLLRSVIPSTRLNVNQGKRHWITGVGATTPLGNDFATIAERLLSGTSAVRTITEFDVSTHPCKIAARPESIPHPPGFTTEEIAHLTMLERLLLRCCSEALHDSGWWGQRGSIRIGMVVGLGAEWMWRWHQQWVTRHRVTTRPNEEDQPTVDVVRRTLGLVGPCLTVGSACSSGNNALGVGRRWLDLGWCDVCLVGACDLPVNPRSIASFGNLRALSTRNEEPCAASRPFDRDRDGFVMGEGGVMFALESDSVARQRSAKVYGELAGFGGSSDAFHLVIPNENPETAATALRTAMDEAQVNPSDIDYLNAHGTSTPVGDRAEARILHLVFGAEVHRIPVSSTKSMTGHLLSAAAAFEALACLIAIDRQTLPPTINLDNPDPECDLNHVANQAQAHPVSITMSNSFGFGGSNNSIIIRKVA